MIPRQLLHATPTKDKSMTATLQRSLGILLTLLLLASCGGGGGSDSTSTPAPSPLSTGTFTDAPTKGLFYYAYPSGLEGHTDAAGHFDYRLGDVVNFKLQVGSDAITLGEFMPGGLNETVTVLSLRNGGLVAQLLQSLDHSTDPTYMDVGGLSLAVDINTIGTWLGSDGQTLPAGKSAQQMLAEAQLAAAGNPTFRYPGAVDANTAVSRARDEIHTQVTSLAASSVNFIHNKLLLHTGYSNYGPVAQLLWFKGDTQAATIINMSTNRKGSFMRSGSYAINHDSSGSNNWVALPDGVAMYMKGNAARGLTSYSTFAGTSTGAPISGAGNYRALVNKPQDVRQQMLTIRGYPACDYYAGTTFVFAADGLSWSAYCESVGELEINSEASPVESGTISVNPELPQLLQLTNSCGVSHYMGVLESGRFAFLTPATTPSAIGRLDTGIVRERGTTKAVLLKHYSGSCVGAGSGTPTTSLYTGRTLNGSVIGVPGLVTTLYLQREGFFYDSIPVQLPDDSSTRPVTFHQIMDTGTYSVTPPPGCTLQGGTGSAENADAFTVDCSNFESSATYLKQGNKTQLFGSNSFSSELSLSNAPFTLNMSPLPDNVPLQVCAAKQIELRSFGLPINSWSCFASGTGMAMPTNPTPASGMPLYVKPDSTAHNYYSSDRRVTTATATTVFVNQVSFLDGLSAGPFQLQVFADKNINGLIDSDELWRATVVWPTAAP